MSGKQKSSLSFEASLGACLSFAGQVLSAASPPVQVCTKEVLSPIVVEAHRFGQQVGKSCGSSSSTSDKVFSVDPRKLLKKLQMYQSEPEWSRAGVQIDRLAFEDLTWDSQGDVAQTLEMELLELESRAAEANLSICVLLTLRASDAKATMGPESAILWLPVENHQISKNTGKKQYLLYACPGRIKVVKSVVELLKKLHEEVKLMSDSNAVYNVWTLSRASTPQVKKKPPAPSVSNQHREPEKTQVVTPRRDETPEKARIAVDGIMEMPEEATLTRPPCELQSSAM
ncbi:Calmodulin-regulated spectrin-associated protein 3 [Globisporangium polare]